MDEASRWSKSNVAKMLGLMVSLSLFASLAVAAGQTGSITGTVADPTGAVIPGIAVVISNQETGQQRTVSTNADGTFVCPDLPPGTYQVEIHAAGFAPLQEGGLKLAAGQTLTLNLKLELGQQATTVTVTESSLHVETTDTATGDTITAAKMATIPLNGRSVTDLLALQPGIVPASSRQPSAVVMSGCTSTSPSGDLNPGNLSISGQRETSNGFILNGSNVEEDFNMGTALVPNLDSIEDFRVLTGNFDAQYGNYSGGQVVVSTKSGTNDLHGSGFEFLRNTNLDARNYFSAGRARYDQNQFGGTLGGAIKRDKAFFFADYQGTRLTQGIETGLISVPSLDERQGNLSGVANSLTGNVNGQAWADLLSQSLGYSISAGEPYYFPGCATTAECVLPTAQIPLSASSSPARALLPSIPLPNQGANVFSASNSDETLRDDKIAARIDTRFGRNSLALYYFFDDYGLDNPYPTAQGGASVPGFNALTQGRSQFVSAGLTTIYSAAMINGFHLSFLRDKNNVGQA